MKLRILHLAVGIAAAFATSVVCLPLLAKSKTDDHADVANWRSATLGVQQAISRGDLKSAENAAKALQRQFPTSGSALRLADVYYLEGKSEESRLLYRSVIMPNLGSTADADVLLRFGSLSEASGMTADARGAYGKVVSSLEGSVDPDLVRPVKAETTPIGDLRQVALALAYSTWHEPGYIAAVTNAVRLAPNQPCTHYCYAVLFAQFRRLREAKAEVDKAAALMPPDQAARFSTFADGVFAFSRWDHTSGGVIGKDGKVTFTTRKIRLPTSSIPMVESPRRDGSGRVANP